MKLYLINVYVFFSLMYRRCVSWMLRLVTNIVKVVVATPMRLRLSLWFS